jgi:hypothetical protein
MGGGLTSRSRIVLTVHRLVLRTGRTPLGRLLALVYRGLARALTAYVTWGEREAAAYIRGSVGIGDFLPGLSDVDTAIVFADDSGSGDPCERARRRWERISRVFPPIGLLLDGPMIYGEADLRDLAGTSALTYGLDGAGLGARHRAGYFGKHSNFDWLRKLERPGLYGATADWRLLRGPDRRPREGQRDAQLRRIAAWLELVYLWRWTYPACIDPTGPRSAAFCVRLVAEPARIWLWLAHGERPPGQQGVLQRALRQIPEEEEALRLALDLHSALPRSPDPPLAQALPALVRISTRIAALINSEVGEGGVTEVRLGGTDPVELIPGGGGWSPTQSLAGGQEPRLLPLADWRALTCPLLPDESFAPLSADPGNPAVLAAAAVSQTAGPYPAICAEGVMLLPAGPWWRTRLRAIECSATDPVSFALMEGGRIARFPKVRGWSAEDAARRAVAEQRARLHGEPGPWAVRESTYGRGGTLAMLLAASRAALFLESIDSGEPELPVTVAETARSLAARSSATRTVAEETLEHYRQFAIRRKQPPIEIVSALRKEVLDLPVYADAPPKGRVESSSS